MPARLRKAALPYLLLLPGLGWLLLFFAIPLVYMALESLKTGHDRHRLHAHLGVLELHGRAVRTTTSSSSARSSTPAWPRCSRS